MRKELAALASQPYVDEETLIIVEESLHADFSFVTSLGFEVIREKKYKTNQHVFLRKIVAENA
jgi:16S rRNA (guanine966-N2)-methyltransferase